jgi:hypothetical protein
LKNNVKHKNEQVQKETLQTGCPVMTNVKPLRENDDLRTKEPKGHKKNDQMGKVGTTSLSLFEAFRIWPYVK